MAPKTRPCRNCGGKHGPPTGKKCRRRRETDVERVLDLFADQQGIDEDWEDVESMVAADQPPAILKEAAPIGLEAKLEARMDRVEEMVASAMTSIKALAIQNDKTIGKPPRRGMVQVSPPLSESEEDVEFLSSARNPRREGRARRKEPAFQQDEFLQSGETISGLNTVLLAGVRQVRHLVENGQEASPLLKHIEFLLKKSTLGVYRHEAYVAYDRTVRARADRDGIEAFGYMATEELATSFCPENLVASKNRDGGSRTKNQGKSPKTTKFCRAYNEGSCTFKNCIFSHACLACEEQGHGKCDCPRLRSRSGGK